MNRKAFTLIELLVVIVIVGILSGFIFVRLNGSISLANDARRKTDLDTIRKALVYYKASSTTGSYPVQAITCTIGGGATPCTNLTTAIVNILPKPPVDPVSGYYTYVSADGSDFTVSTTLSNSTAYSYTASTGFSSSVPVSYTSTCAASTNSQVQCTETTDGSYVINKFTYLSSSGTTTWAVPSGVASIEYLVVGGGGGSVSYACGGGGGAGGYRAGELSVTPNNTVSIEVGAGGTSTDTNYVQGNPGGQSKFGTIIAAGGGGGGRYYANPGGSGGSGGGGGGTYPTSGASGVGGSGSAGNSGGGGGNGDGEHCRGGGGGGGAGGAGGSGTTSSGGAGGVGLVNDITGTNVYYAGGGAGGGYSCVGGAGTQMTGGGGAGEYWNGSYNYLPATRNGINGTGGGAGASINYDSVGGSGVVIVRYLHP